MPSLNWKETGLVLQSPKVPSKHDSYILRSSSNFFCWSALRCLQFSLTIDLRSTYLYLLSRICVAHLAMSCLLCSSMAKLLFSFSVWSILAPWRWLMFLIGEMISSIIIVLALKSCMNLTLWWFLWQELGHTVAYYPCCTQPHHVLNSTFCYQSIHRSLALS